MSFFGNIGDFLFGNDDAEQAHRRAQEADARAREVQNAAYRESMGYLKQIPGILSEHFAPYEQAGRRSLPRLESEYQRLTSNPSDILKTLGSGYESSPGYQFRKNESLRGIDRAAAAGGSLGTPAHQRLNAEMAGNLAGADYYPYLENALRLYSSGLRGNEGLANMGYSAASNLGEDISNSMMSTANLGYSHGSNEAQQMRAAQAYLEQLRPKSRFGSDGGIFNNLLGQGLANIGNGLNSGMDHATGNMGSWMNKTRQQTGLSQVGGMLSGLMKGGWMGGAMGAMGDAAQQNQGGNPYQQYFGGGGQNSSQPNGTYWERR
jgi:hypothetical protein